MSVTSIRESFPHSQGIKLISLGFLFLGISKGFSRLVSGPLQAIILPSDDVLIQFVSILETTHQKISNNQHQTTALAAIRDALLPKLMNGEIEV